MYFCWNRKWAVDNMLKTLVIGEANWLCENVYFDESDESDGMEDVVCFRRW